MTRASPHFRHMVELIRLVETFECATLPSEEWDHPSHLAVAAWYLIHFDECAATDRMITGIRRYNRANAIAASPAGGYHETLTLFWLALVRDCLAANPAERVLDRVNGVLRTYGHRRRLHLEFYSRTRIMSARARSGWVPPDLQPLPSRPPCAERRRHRPQDLD